MMTGIDALLLHTPILLNTDTNTTSNTTNAADSNGTTMGVDDHSEIIWRYFLSLMIIILFHRAVGTIFHKMHIPRIIGDIVAGCLLGPSIMGVEANDWLFPPMNRAILNMFGQFGLIMTSMAAGFSFDRRVMKGRTGKIAAYTLMNMSIPAVVSVPLYFILPNNSNWRGPEWDGPAFYVLIACAMSSSALPMVFLILDEMRLNNDTSRFAIGLSCLSTIGLFTLLSVVSVLSDPSLSESIIIIRLIFLALVFVVLFCLQWIWGYLITHSKKNGSLGFLRYGSDDMALIVIGLGLISAICSERLGYTFLLGAFLAGAAMPFDIGLRSNLGEKVRWMTRWIFLPNFFVAAGLQFNLRLLKAESIPYVLLFIILAFGAKAALVPISHYLLRLGWRDAAFCASLANCRGFNALIVAQVGAQYGVIGNSFFITCVLLSILSTGATGPLARFFRPQDESARLALRQPVTPMHSGVIQPIPMKELSTEMNQPTPRLLKEEDRKSAENSTNKMEEEEDMDVHIALPNGLSTDEHMSASSSSLSTITSSCDPLDREMLFSSWLSESYDSKMTVLVIIAEDLKSRLRDPSTSSKLATDSSSGEVTFRGDAFVDYLCQIYSITDRSIAVRAGQKLLEAGVIAPVESVIFFDKPMLFACG